MSFLSTVISECESNLQEGAAKSKGRNIIKSQASHEFSTCISVVIPKSNESLDLGIVQH